MLQLKMQYSFLFLLSGGNYKNNVALGIYDNLFKRRINMTKLKQFLKLPMLFFVMLFLMPKDALPADEFMIHVIYYNADMTLSRHEVKINRNTTVKDVKKQLAKSIGISAESQKFFISPSTTSGFDKELGNKEMMINHLQSSRFGVKKAK